MMKTIVTHSGTFHADEALAVFMLHQLPEYKSSKIIRTRDPLIISTADIVVDVGGVYDLATLRFDHHQRTFTETFSAAHNIRLSSAGLVYKHLGRRVLASLLTWPLDHPDLSLVYAKVYDSLILMFDGVDNGVSQYAGESQYSDSTTISSRVSRLNPAWNAAFTDDVLDAQFLKAVAITGEELLATVEWIANGWIPARGVVLDGFKGRFDVHPSGKIIAFSQYEIEAELEIKADELPLYALFEDSLAGWRIKAIPESSDSFISRKALPEPWRGVRDQALSDLTGVDGCVFVHASGFIGGVKSREAAVQLAVLALTM